MLRLTLVVWALSAALAPVAVASGQVSAPSGGPAPRFDGPPPPVHPAVVSRDGKGQATVRATRLEQPLTLDGQLDEEIYQRVPAISDFIQQEPREGEPTTERTDVWVFFDDTTMYVSVRCFDSHPERAILTELRRDSGNITNNESFSVILDTFLDRRNGFFFQSSPLGAIRDQAITDEGNQNESWNTVWFVRPGRFDGGWSLEFAIPFKSLRYRGSGPQVWGINFRRVIRWKNEHAFLTRVPVAYGMNALFRLSTAGTLVGLETPRSSMNLELKPYVGGSLVTDRSAAVPRSNQLTRNVGFDFKYGLTRSLIADVTYNTDFAQVEEDLQQANLTRFSLFFPEKREFFLEGQGTYSFAGVQLRNNNPDAGDVPVPFFSRRIGLSQGLAVPILAGARLTGKAGRYGIGLLNIETADKPSAGALRTNFTAVRLKRDILRRSNVGIIATRRSPGLSGVGDNLVAGVDLNMAFFRNVSLTSYFAKTHTDGRRGDDTSYRARFDYAADRYGLSLEEASVGANFNPEAGYVRRLNYARTFGLARFSPRPKGGSLVRKYTWDTSFDYVTDAHRTRVENRQWQSSFVTEFQNSDRLTLEYTRDYEFLPQDFTIAPKVVVPRGGYDYAMTKVSYVRGQQRRMSGTTTFSRGSFYDGRRTEVTHTGRGVVASRFALEPTLSLNWVSLPYADFSVRLVGTRVVVTPTPRLAISSLVQLNASAHTLSSSVRLRWEYTGGSELFVVYSDGRNTLNGGIPNLVSRSLAIKLTRLFRF